MAYTTLAQVKNYLDIGADSDDVLFSDLISRAQAAIDAYVGMTFEAVTATRYFESDSLGYDNTLFLDRWLLTITTLTNGDDDATVIPNTDYWLIDRNAGPPYYGIRLYSDSDYSWEWDTDGWVSVLGTWGYSTTAPADIVHAAIRLVAYYYAQKDSQVFDVTAVPEAGIITVPQGVPRDVERILEKYKAKVAWSFRA